MSAKTYRIGEAATLLNLKTYVLRFWEMEFPQISPVRTEKGQRLYTESDVAVLRRIRFLLHERGLTIEGARRILVEEAAKGGLSPLQEGMPFVDPELDDGLADTPPHAPQQVPQQTPQQVPLPSVPTLVGPPPPPHLHTHAPQTGPPPVDQELLAELRAIRSLLLMRSA